MLTSLLIASGIVLAAGLLNNNSNSDNTNTTTNNNTRKSIKDFSYFEIKTELEYELYGKSTSELDDILRQNGYYSESNLSIYEIAEKLASSAQYGNRLNPTYLANKLEDRLNNKYNR